MSDTALPQNDLVNVLRMHARKQPDRVAITFLGDGEQVTEVFTYAELDRRARGLASLLQAQASPGERALLLLPCGPDYVLAFLACLYAGLIAVPAYPAEIGQPQAVKRLLSVASDAAPSLALTHGEGAASLALHGLARPDMRVLVTTGLRGDPAAWQERGFRPDDIAFLQYTSGSTASPKGVMVTHGNLLANSAALTHAFTERADDRYLSWLPLFHDMGLILGLLQPLFYGLPLVLMSPKHFLERPRRWLQAISTHRATVSCGPDFAYRLCADRIRPESIDGLDLSSWRVAACGAEPVRQSSLLRFAELARPLGFDDRSFNPCYGLAEATLFASGHPQGGLVAPTFDVEALAGGIAKVAAKGITLVSCGSPHPGTLMRIADPVTGASLPNGQVGEIWLNGPTVAAGYWRNLAATQATFHGRGADDGLVFLRTGDLGFVHEGQVYLSSRLKDLIILRGRNFYPQDIELAVEEQVHGVRPGRVAAFSVDRDGAEAIGIAAEIARLRPGEGAPADVVERIREVVAHAFNEPVAAVALLKPGALPKTSSGKLQRSAAREAFLANGLPLVAEYRAERFAGIDAAAPGDILEGLARLWSELLQVDRVGPLDNFFALGGQSLLMSELACGIEASFGVRLSLAACFNASNLSEMAAFIKRGAAGGLPPLPKPTSRHDTLLPMSHAQERLWFLQSLSPGSSSYHVATGLQFSARVDPERLKLAFEQLVSRHDSLRTVFLETEEGPRQRVLPRQEVAVEVLEVEDEPGFEVAVRSFLSHPFDLAAGPLWRVALIGAPGDMPQRLVIAMHHIVVDGGSLPSLLGDLTMAYTGRCLDRSLLQYADLAGWQRAELEPRLPSLMRTWAAVLKGAPAQTTLPPDMDRPPVQTHRGKTLRLVLRGELVSAADQWARSENASLFMVLFAAYAAALAASAGQRDLVIGTDVANRPRASAGAVVGFFVNQLAVRCQLAGTAGPEVLRTVRKSLLDAYSLQDLPFDKLVEVLRPSRTLSHQPVFQTKFVYQEMPVAYALGPGLQMVSFDVDRDAAELDLLFDLVRRGDEVSIRIEYAADLYRAETIERFAAGYVARLEDWVGGQATKSPSSGRKPLPRRAARQTTAEASP